MATFKSAPVALRFDPEVKRAMAVIADREGRSKANMMEWLIRKHCEREGLGWPIEDANASGGQLSGKQPKPLKAASPVKADKVASPATGVKRASKNSKTD